MLSINFLNLLQKRWTFVIYCKYFANFAEMICSISWNERCKYLALIPQNDIKKKFIRARLYTFWINDCLFYVLNCLIQNISLTISAEQLHLSSQQRKFQFPIGISENTFDLILSLLFKSDVAFRLKIILNRFACTSFFSYSCSTCRKNS